MKYLAILVFVFTGMQLVVALVNIIFRQKLRKSNDECNNLVSILIPARNEEKNIGNLLDDILAQDYQNFEIMVFNDQSTDHTSPIVAGFEKKDGRVKLIHSSGLPDGWLGKNHACHTMSKLAKGDYLLFLDADVRIGNQIIHQTLSMSRKYKLGLVSIFPRQIMKTLGEWVTVPLMNYILLTLLPLILVRKSMFASMAAANGQFMLFDAEVYRKHLPHKQFKNNKVEDIETARFFKQNGIRIACLTGNESMQCHMYQGFSEAVNGFAKNVTHFFGNSFTMAVGFWLVTTFGFISIAFAMPLWVLYSYLVAIVVVRVLVSLASRQHVFYNLILIIPQQISLGLFIFKAFLVKFKKQYKWKGRNISWFLSC
jgi:glycosyltransferase involved in cell wall biosynthesis